MQWRFPGRPGVFHSPDDSWRVANRGVLRAEEVDTSECPCAKHLYTGFIPKSAVPVSDRGMHRDDELISNEMLRTVCSFSKEGPYKFPRISPPPALPVSGCPSVHPVSATSRIPTRSTTTTHLIEIFVGTRSPQFLRCRAGSDKSKVVGH